MSIFTLYYSFSRATLLEETRTRWLHAQWYCSYGNRPNRHEDVHLIACTNLKKRERERVKKRVSEREKYKYSVKLNCFLDVLQAFQPWEDLLFKLTRMCCVRRWKQPEYLEREREMILLLSCSLISCLPFKWISHLHVCLRPGSNPAYPSHNDQFSLQTTPAETCSVGCHFITFNLHYLRLKLTFRLLYFKNKTHIFVQICQNYCHFVTLFFFSSKFQPLSCPSSCTVYCFNRG